MTILCPCGQYINGTNATIYTTATYNDKGEVVFAICQHGIVVINKLEEEVDINGKDNNKRP